MHSNLLYCDKPPLPLRNANVDVAVIVLYNVLHDRVHCLSLGVGCNGALQGGVNRMSSKQCKSFAPSSSAKAPKTMILYYHIYGHDRAIVATTSTRLIGAKAQTKIQHDDVAQIARWGDASRGPRPQKTWAWSSIATMAPKPPCHLCLSRTSLLGFKRSQMRHLWQENGASFSKRQKLRCPSGSHPSTRLSSRLAPSTWQSRGTMLR